MFPHHYSRSLTHCCKQLPAGILARPACLGTDATVVMMVSMLFTLSTAHPARLNTSPDERPHKLGIERGVAGQYTSCCCADISTVEVRGDTGAEFSNGAFAQASISTRRTGL